MPPIPAACSPPRSFRCQQQQAFLRRLACLLLPALLTAGWAFPAAAEPMGEVILDGRILVRGLASLPPDRLARALAADDDLLLLSRPQANRRLFLSAVARKATLALQRGGFESPKVSASIEPTGEGSGERIVVDVAEGPRSIAAGIEITGLPDDLNGELHRWLQSQRPPPGALAEEVDGANGWGGVRWVDDNGQPAKMEEPLWTRGEPAAFDPPHTKSIRTAIARFLRDAGRFAAAKLVDDRKPVGLLAGLSGLASATRSTGLPAAATIDVAVKASSNGAILSIDVRNLPPASVLRDIEIPAGSRTTKDDLLKLLGIRIGAPITEQQRLVWRQALWLSGRFLTANVTLRELPTDADGAPGVVAVFELDDYPAATPLGTDPSPEEFVMLRFREWLIGALAGGDDFVVDWRRPAAPDAPPSVGQSTGELVISATEGLLVTALPDSTEACGIAVSPGRLGWFLPRSAGRFELPIPADGRMTAQIRLSLARKEEEGKTTYQRNLSLGAGFESRPRGSAATFAILLGIDPVACLALVHEGDPRLTWEGEELVVAAADEMVARFHAPTGRLLSIQGSDGSGVSIRTAAGRFAAVIDSLRTEAGDDRAHEEALLTSAVDFFTDTSAASAFDRTSTAAGLAAGIVPLQKRFGALFGALRRAGAAGGFTAVDHTLSALLGASAISEAALVIPLEKSAASDPLTEAGRMAATQAWRITEQVCGRAAWISSLARAAALGAVQDPAILEEMATFMSAEHNGPVAYLTAAKAAPMPLVGVTLARRGQERLTTAAFHADCQPLVQLLAATGIDRSVTVILRTLSDDEARLVGEMLLQNPDALLPLVRDQRSRDSESAAIAALPESLDCWWEESLRGIMAASLADTIAPRTAGKPADGAAPIR